MKRIVALIVCVCTLAMVLCLHASAMVRRDLLDAERTALISDSGSFTYTEDGVLVLESTSEDGATVVIPLDLLMNLGNMRYLQMSLSSDCAFNIALRVSGTGRDFYPQLTGPSWYEAFQETAPAEGDGVSEGGVFTLSQDIVHYAAYNEMPLSEDSYATVKSVFISVKGIGKLTLEHLMLSDSPDFMTMSNHVGTLVDEVPLLPDYTLDFTNGEEEEHHAPTLPNGDGMREGQEWDTIRPILWIAGAAVVVTVIAVIVVRKKVPNRFSLEDFDDSDE